MPLHRIVTIDGFSADPVWYETQADPDPELFVATIAADGPGELRWWVMPYNGDTPGTSMPSSGAGMTINARLVYSMPAAGGGSKREYIGRGSIDDVHGDPISVGREMIEQVQAGTNAVIQMISITGAPPGGTTHLWISYRFQRSP